MAKCATLAGKVKNSGSMEVKALYQQTKTKTKKPTVKTGGDLRSSKSGK